MPEMTEYTVASDQRWDNLAWRLYGDAKRIDDLIAANPSVPAGAIVPAGTRLRVPVVAIRRVNEALLPPWKR